jgi:hypothetical protein
VRGVSEDHYNHMSLLKRRFFAAREGPGTGGNTLYVGVSFFDRKTTRGITIVNA